MYSIASLTKPYFYASTMICRLFGYANTQKLPDQSVHLIDATSDSYVMDSGAIRSNNLCIKILKYRKKHNFSENIVPPFYVSVYVMDVISFTSDSPSMSWKWTIQVPMPIHIYHSILRESKYQHYFYKNFHGVVLPILQFVFNEKCPRISPEANNHLLSVGKWFGQESFSYVRVSGSLAHAHVLPLYIPDKLLAREIAYQTVESDLSKVMKNNKKTM